jgi:hypothetical protein
MQEAVQEAIECTDKRADCWGRWSRLKEASRGALQGEEVVTEEGAGRPIG